MFQKLSPHLIDLIRDALLKSFWRKNALISFLRRMSVSEGYLASLRQDESKRAWLDRLFPDLEKSVKGAPALMQIATALAEQTTFPDLAGWEDCAQKVKAAEGAVDALKKYMGLTEKAAGEDKEAAKRLGYEYRAPWKLEV